MVIDLNLIEVGFKPHNILGTRIWFGLFGIKLDWVGYDYVNRGLDNYGIQRCLRIHIKSPFGHAARHHFNWFFGKIKKAP